MEVSGASLSGREPPYAVSLSRGEPPVREDLRDRCRRRRELVLATSRADRWLRGLATNIICSSGARRR